MSPLSIAVFAIIELILFLTFKDNFYHVAPSLILSKLYSNSLLVLLNNRESLRRGKQDVGLPTSNRGQSTISRGAIHVNINNETFSDNMAMVSLRRVSMLVFSHVFLLTHPQSDARDSKLGKKATNVVLGEAV